MDFTSEHYFRASVERMSQAQHLTILRSAVNDVAILWHNNYRFASESRLLAHLKKIKSRQRSKGDLLKASAYDLLKAAQRFIDKGVLQWR
jgi:hypothetical protein